MLNWIGREWRACTSPFVVSSSFPADSNFILLDVSGSSSLTRRFLEVDPLGTGTSLALMGSTLPYSSCMHRRCHVLAMEESPQDACLPCSSGSRHTP